MGNSDFQQVLLPGVTLESITPPSLPRTFLPRPNLIDFLEKDSPRAQIIMAPAGFGKTTIGAHWASLHPGSVWFTSNTQDDVRTVLSRIVCAIRRVERGFASWLTPELDVVTDLELYIKKVTAEIGGLGRVVNFVFDDLEKMPPSNARFIQIWTDNLPLNVRTLSLRRNAPLLSYERAVELGVLKYLAAFDVRFQDDEIIKLKNLYNLEIQQSELLHSAQGLNGWPAGIVMFIEGLSHLKENLHDANRNPYIERFIPADLKKVFSDRNELLELGIKHFAEALERAAYPGYTVRGRGISALTERELEILKMLNSSNTIEKIAASLFISVNTLKTHLKSLYRKLEVKNRDEAVLRGHELSYI